MGHDLARYKYSLSETYCVGGVAQMVERSLSMREVPGSIPGASNCVGGVAQMVERSLSMREVPGSIPDASN
ncbi:hypothetical protein CDAR_456601 [Caerostris darwini]|uniref:Uncharacterized protein n=1 Tax=Caerostris darwini TaxID=1538125 RepID=A0AAV4RZH7_9ARAC|nr:hypothetical protein CDAR_456601 [Caerostris darwini]